MSILNSKGLVLLPIFVLLFSSCTKDDEDTNSDYLGTWSSIEYMTVDGGTVQVKDVMIFSKDGVTDIAQIYNPSTKSYLDFAKLNGTISVNGSTMLIKVVEVGQATVDTATGKISESIIMYKQGSREFDKTLIDAGLTQSFESEYSISGNRMTLKTDHNNDGDYLDENEITVYTKQ